MGVADVLMIGKLDAVNLAAASLANSIYFLICILGIGTLFAVSPLVARSKGAGYNEECSQLYRFSILAAIVLSAFITAAIYLLTLNLDWLMQKPAVTELTKSYLHIINISTLPLLLFSGIKQYSDGLSFTKPSAVITLIALLLNVFLNWLLIYGHWGFPKLELDGAGIATTISRYFMLFTMLVFIHSHIIYKPFLKLNNPIKDYFLFKEIFRVGMPSGFQYFFEIGAFSGAAVIIGWISEYALAAHQVAISIASVTYMIATGISAAGSICVGDAWGRAHKKDIVAAGKTALVLGAAFMGCCAITLAIFNTQIVGLFVQDDKVAKMAANLLIIAAFFQLSDGVQCVGLGILRGIADTKVPTFITIIAYWVIGLPLGYYLAFYLNLGLYGVWAALAVALSASAIMLTIRFFKLSNKVNLAYHHSSEL